MEHINTDLARLPQPITTLQELRTQEFLPQLQDPIISASGTMSRLLTQLRIHTSSEPVSMHNIATLLESGAPPDEHPAQAVKRIRAIRNYIMHSLVEPGIVTASSKSSFGKRGGRHLEFTTTPHGQDRTPLLATIAAWQLCSPIAFTDILSEYAILKVDSEDFYGSYIVGDLRVLQTAITNQHVNAPAVQRLTKHRIKTSTAAAALRRLELKGLLETKDKGWYVIEPTVRRPIKELFLSMSSLRDDGYRQQAADTGKYIVSQPSLVGALLARRIVDQAQDGVEISDDADEKQLQIRLSPSRPEATLPLWFTARVETSLLPKTKQEVTLERVLTLLQYGALDVVKDKHAFAFSEHLREYFKSSGLTNPDLQLHALAKQYMLERLIYGSVMPIDRLESGIGIRTTLATHTQTVLAPLLRAYMRQEAVKSLV